MPQPTEDAFDHDHGGIDDQSEIDRADRQQVGRFPAQHQDADREEQRERDGGADDDRAAQIAEEQPLQQEDQRDAEHHVVQDRAGGDVDQVLAVVDALDAHAGRQDAGAVDALDLLLDPVDGRHALLAAAHQHDALHDVVVVVLAGDAEARLDARPSRSATSLTRTGIAAALGQHGVAEIVDRADEPDAAHHRGLRARY